MCEPDPIATPLLLLLAALAYATRPENARPFHQQWYRGCGWDDLRTLRGSLSK